MRVLMLGWEFPPYITGGLGTACYGLTKALDRRGISVLFGLPKSVAGDAAEHVKILSPQTVATTRDDSNIPIDPFDTADVTANPDDIKAATELVETESLSEIEQERVFQHLRFIGIPVAATSAYARPGEKQIPLTDEVRQKILIEAVERGNLPKRIERSILHEVLPERHVDADDAHGDNLHHDADYTDDLLGQVHRYARFCLAAARQHRFDVIHAHDWLTYPAGLAVARLTGKPLVAHVHSTEFDRSGEHVNQQLYDIERRGMHGAMRIITVSQLTRDTCVYRYGVSADKIDVVYNGVELAPTQQGSVGIDSKDKIVLYFGRITMQKGPEYFIAAAKRVLDVMDNVKFVVAGSGDMASRMIELAARMGIGHKVLFTGFLRGGDITRVFGLADLYVMPSVSEPFGIAPLEAMSHDVPAIISKSSGVSEVLTHALKVDFWDIDDIANKIVAVLRHPPLSRTLREHGAFEVRRITWDGAAERCEKIYQHVVAKMK